jgi:hypothetical protein
VSYTRGTDTGRVRELVGDINSEFFSDEQILDALTEQGSVSRATISFLMRIHNDVDLILRKFGRAGNLDPAAIDRIQARLMQQVDILTKGPAQGPGTTLGWVPDADVATVSQQTDEDGLRKRTNVDDHLEDLEERT